MTESTVSRGHDTYVRENAPTADRGSTKNVQLDATASAVKRGLVYFPLPSLAGRTVLSATLVGHARGAMAAQTLGAIRLSESFSASKATWNNQPSATGPTATTAIGALADGDEFTIDVTTQIQAVANGAKWYGLRITTTNTGIQRASGFASGRPAWSLVYELSDVPEQPSILTPDGSLVVSLAQPVLTWDFTDFGGSTDQAAFQVQIDPAADDVTPDFDTGETAGTEPEYDTSTGSYPGFSTAGGTTQWRVRVKDGDGNWSDWSDWATWTYRAKPTLTMDSPAGSTLSDTSPTILAHISTSLLDSWQIRVANGTDRTQFRYDSGRLPADDPSDIAHTIPWSASPRGRPLIVFGGGQTSWWLNVRAWDTYPRIGTPGDPTYVEQWVEVTQDDTGTAPVLTAVTKPGVLPQVKLTWTHGSAPDQWLILRDGQPYARVDPADVTAGGGTYEWTDPAYTAPRVEHTYRVKGITGGVQTNQSNAVVFSFALTGVWLITEDGDFVVLRGTDSPAGWQQLDRSALYKTLDGRTITVVDGQEGFSGSFRGTLWTSEVEHTRVEGLAVLEAIKDNPTSPVWIVTADIAFPAILRNLSYPPNTEVTSPTRLANAVSFDLQEEI